MRKTIIITVYLITIIKINITAIRTRIISRYLNSFIKQPLHAELGQTIDNDTDLSHHYERNVKSGTWKRRENDRRLPSNEHRVSYGSVQTYFLYTAVS